MVAGLHRNRRGDLFVESLFVVPLLLMLFIFIVEMGFLMYNWAVLNFYTGSSAVTAAARGRFSDEIRIRLAQNINDWTINGRGYSYDVTGTDLPGTLAGSTVYIYGSDRSTPIQRGSYLNVSVNYPWRFKFFLVDGAARFIVSEGAFRLKVNASVPSEVFIE